MSENIPFPGKLITYLDLAKGLGHATFHMVTDQLRHQGISEHKPKVESLRERSVLLSLRQVEIHRQMAALSAEEIALVEERQAVIEQIGELVINGTVS